MTSNNSASNGLKLQRNEGLKKFLINKIKSRNHRPKSLNTGRPGPCFMCLQLYTFTIQ